MLCRHALVEEPRAFWVGQFAHERLDVFAQARQGESNINQDGVEEKRRAKGERGKGKGEKGKGKGKPFASALPLYPFPFTLRLLDVVVERKLQRVRAHAHRVDLALALVADPAFNQARREHVALEKKLVVGFQRGE